jgi:hypothetical protein
LSVAIDKESKLHLNWKSPFDLADLGLLVFLTSLLFAGTILCFRDYRSAVSGFGDSGAYTEIASAIRRWDFTGVQVKQFWGYPYAMALVSAVTRVSDQASLLLVSFASSFIAIALAYRLWGGWIASLFVVLNFDWMQRSFLGGSEPLFVALLFASFLAARKERWILATCFASLATVTRPVGILALVSIGIVLLGKREYKKFFLCTGIGLLVGMLYLLPFWVYFHDPLYEVHRYKTADWQSGSAIGIPFVAIAESIVHNHAPWTNLLLTTVWMTFVIVGTVAMARKGMRQYAFQHAPQFLFAFLYVAFLFTYNSTEWARAEFVRFAIPVIPLLLLSLQEWIPKSRVILWGLGMVSPVLAAASALGIRNVAHILLR